MTLMKGFFKTATLLFALTAFMITPPGIRIALYPLASNSVLENTKPGELFVLGGGYNKERVLGISTEERISHALTYIRPDLDAVHIIDYIGINSDSYRQRVNNLLHEHITTQKIHFHLRSHDTVDNCAIIASIMKSDKTGLVITSPYHVLRTRMTLRLMDVQGVSVVSPKKSEVYSFHSWHQWKRNCHLVFREYPALVIDLFLLTFT